MTGSSSLELGLKWFKEDFADVPHSEAVLARWPGLLENPSFLAHAKVLKEFQNGLDPMPNRGQYDTLIRETGHELAAMEALGRRTNYLRILFGSSSVGHHHYLGVHATVAALLLDRGRAMRDEEVTLFYSSMDRLLRGGADWQLVTHVPTATRAFYQALKSVKWPLSADASSSLLEIIQVRSEQLFEGAAEGLMAVMAAACIMLGAAACVKRGGTKVSPSDAIEGCLAYLRLFDTDLRSLPLVQREGPSGYELA